MLWLIVRLGLVALGADAGTELLSRDDSTMGTAATGVLLLVLVCMGAVLVVTLMAVVRLGRRRRRQWSRPSWKVRPFLGEPLQFMHAMAFFFLAAGLSAGVRALVGVQRPFVTAAIAVGFGAGQLLGVHLTVRIFPGDFEPAAKRSPDLA